MKMKKSQKQGKNAFIEAHTATKRPWVMVLFIFFMIFLIGSVSAFEFDNFKNYDEETKTITIRNGLTFGTKISEIELKTPLNYLVPRGYQKIAEFEVRAFTDYNNAFKELELFDKKKGMNKFVRNYDFKVLSYENIIVDDYKEDCNLPKTKDGFCQWIVSGNHVETKEKWIKLTLADFNKTDNFTIGIFTEVKKGDNVEWVPNFFGVRINEWATWTESLEVGLINYYRFEETSGVVVDFMENNDGTNDGSTRGVIGKIDDAFSYDGINDNVIATSGIAGDTSVSVSVWFNLSGTSNRGVVTLNSNGGSSASGFAVSQDSSNKILCVLEGVGWCSGTTAVSYNVWHHLVMTRSGNDYKVYLDGSGTPISSGTIGGGTFSNTNIIGARSETGLTQFFDGGIDEVGIWSRVLNSTEISDLYNGDSGISPPGNVNIILNSPVDTYNSSTPTISFNGSVVSPGGITNVSLIINDTNIETNSTGLNDTDYLFTYTLIEGTHTWTYEACNNNGCLNVTARNLTIDTTFPELNITLPLNGTTNTDNYTTSPTVSISLNWTVSDTNLDSCWYYNTTANVSITCGNNATITLPYGGYTFIVYANDSAGNENSLNVTSTWGYKLLQNSITYNVNAYELSNEEFKINVSSTGEQTVASNIVYNGTSYLANKAGDNILMEFSRTIPLYTAGNNSFYWSFGYGSEIINSSTYFQNVSETNLANCTSGTKYFNLLLKDEKTMELLNSSDNISIETVFLYYINDISVNKTFVSSFSQNTVSFCLDPPIENVKVFGEISYDDDLHVKERHFILFENFTNSTTTNISMYDLATSESTSFLVFTETEGAPYPDVYMKLKRQYLNLNDFVVVEMAKADSFGQTVLHFVTEDEIYKIDFYDEDGNLVLTTEPFQAVCIDNVCSMSFKVDLEGGIIPPFQGISPDGNLVFTLSLVGNDTAVLLNYVSTNGSAYNLQMKTAGFSIVNDTVIVCTETQTNTISGSMSCNISSYPFTTYVTELWVNDVLNDIQYSSVTNDAWKDFGNEGIIYTILIIMALTLLLIYTPELCVLGSIAGVLISAKFGFIPMTYVSGMYLVVAGIIIIFKMRKS